MFIHTYLNSFCTWCKNIQTVDTYIIQTKKNIQNKIHTYIHTYIHNGDFSTSTTILHFKIKILIQTCL